MQFNLDATIYSAGGDDLGKLERIVLDPGTGEISHIIVRKGWFFTEDRVIPIDLVDTASEDEIRLKDDIEDLEALPLFEESYFIDADPVERDMNTEEARAAAAPLYWYPPVASPVGFPAYYGRPYVTETERNIPDDTVPLKDNAPIFTKDGEEIGRVDQLFADEDGRVTHLLVSSGLIFTKRKMVPSHWISSVAEERIKLGVDSETLKWLPDYEE
jgi:sporulation protein YlmC with PRC-barrel domain